MTQEELIQQIEKKSAELAKLEESLISMIEESLGDIQGKCAYTRDKASGELCECIFDINEIDSDRWLIILRGGAGIEFEWSDSCMTWDYDDSALVYNPSNQVLEVVEKDELLQIISEEIKKILE